MRNIVPARRLCGRRALKSIFCLVGSSALALGASAAVHGNEPPSVKERLKDPRPVVAAHRGCFQFAPENSLKAVKACVDLGVDVVEGDLRTTKDGVVVLLHDATLNRTTNASGPLKSYTYAELKNVRLRDGAGGQDAVLTDERIPTLAEVLKAAKSGILFVFECKELDCDPAFDVIAAEGAQDRVIFYLDAAAGSVKLRNARFLGQVAYIPMVWQCGGTYGRQKDCYKVLSEAAADYQPFNPVAYMAFADAPFFDKKFGVVLDGGNDAAAWDSAISGGAGLMFTDRPVELMKYLQAKGLR